VQFRIPECLRVERDELQGRLAKAARCHGPVGEAAKAATKLLRPHFIKEEEFALPPLGLLALLSTGRLSREMAKAVPLTERLRAELSQMLAEHGEILAALKNLAEVAETAGQIEHVDLARRFAAHVTAEEELLYPASIVIGECLKWKLKP